MALARFREQDEAAGNIRLVSVAPPDFRAGKSDLGRFKELIESQRFENAAW